MIVYKSLIVKLFQHIWRKNECNFNEGNLIEILNMITFKFGQICYVSTKEIV